MKRLEKREMIDLGLCFFYITKEEASTYLFYNCEVINIIEVIFFKN